VRNALFQASANLRHKLYPVPAAIQTRRPVAAE